MKKGLLFSIASLLIATAFAQVSVTVGPYLQSPTPNSVKVLWRTDSLTSVKVMYGTSPSSLTQTVVDTSVSGRHAVKLDNLSPYTRYYYAIYNDTVFAEGGDSLHTFRTFPVAGTNTPVRVWAIGDFGKGNENQARVRDAYTNYDTVGTDLWLWLGDNVYQDGTEAEYLTKVFDSVYGYQKIMKHLPFEPAPGNHDYNSVAPVGSSIDPLLNTGPYFDLIDVYKNAEAGGIATGHELFYSYDYGNVHFVSLNSEIGSIFSASYDWTGASPFNTFTTSPMSQWLHQDLQANTKPWTVVYFHQPPYTDGSHDAGSFWEIYMRAMRHNFAEIWEQYGVDLVVCGHSHVYERSYLVRGAYEESADITVFNYVQTTSGVEAQGEAYIKYTQGTNANYGTVYVVQGNSGSSDDAPPFGHPYMYAEYGCDTCCGSLVLDIDSNRLDGRHIDMYGQEQDHFTIYKVFGEAPSGVKELADVVFEKLSIAPNPFSNSTTVSFDLKKNELVKVNLLDALGQVVPVFEGDMPKGNNRLEINATQLKLAKGVYTVQLRADGRQLSRQIVIQ